jgi:hypothetical protein
VGGRRNYSVADIDETIRNAPADTRLTVSLISQGEHVERPGLLVTDAIKKQTSPSGITGSKPTHRFRASGWTRHYETYSEILQMLAQLALGLVLANFKNHGLNLRSKLAAAAFILLALGVALTARYFLATRRRRFRCLPNPRAAGVVAARSQFIIASRSRQSWTLAPDASSSIRTRHGRRARALG